MLTSVQALYRQENTWHRASHKNYSMTVKRKLQSCTDKLAAPFHARFYIYGLNAHKRQTIHRLKPTYKVVSSDCRATA